MKSQMLKRGVEIFGDKESFMAWLHCPSLAFAGQTPLSLLHTPSGVEMVLDEIGRIEHGVLS